MNFTVYGLPQPAGSKRAFPIKRAGGKLGVAVADANPKAKGWKQEVAHAAAESFEVPLECPVEVTFLFLLPRPKGHMGKHGVRPSAPWAPAVRPDLLKLARAIEDAMIGIAYRDDAQIVTEVLRKRYTETSARVEIEVLPKEEC